MKTTLSALFLAVISLAGCQSKPTLKQVDASAEAKQINTPEMAAKLKSQYGK